MSTAREQVERINAIATLLLETWKRVDPRSGVAQHPTSYVATFADMARAVIANESSQLIEARAERDAVIAALGCEREDGVWWLPGDPSPAQCKTLADVVRRTHRQADYDVKRVEAERDALRKDAAQSGGNVVTLTHAQIDAGIRGVEQLAFFRAVFTADEKREAFLEMAVPCNHTAREIDNGEWHCLTCGERFALDAALAVQPTTEGGV